MASGRVFEAIAVENAAPEDDIEAAYQSWRSGLEDSDSPGMVRAFRVPLDEQGKPSYSATGQVRLGTWPIDQYDFDALCSKILREYMLPTETMMAVRLIGTVQGKGGLRFNKIVTLQRPNNPNLVTQQGGPGKDGVTEIMRQIQESNQAMMRMFQEMHGKPASMDGGGEMMRAVAMMSVLTKPMTDMMGPLLAAFAGRPQAAPGPSTSMKEMLESMMIMDRFLGRRGGGGGPVESSPEWVKVVQAVSGVAKPLLEMAAANQVQGTRTRANVPRVAAPSPAQPAVAQPIGATAPRPTPSGAAPTVAPGGVDLSQPSAPGHNPFAPGPDTQAPSTNLGDPSMFAETKKQVDALIDVAESGADPSAVADQFFEMTMLQIEKEDDYAKLCALVESDGFLKSIAIYNPKVSVHSEWLGRVRGRLIERIQEADSPGDN